MNGKDLRTLAKEHASGVLNKEEYRKLRSKLFDDIISGKMEVEDREFLPPIGINDGDATVETVINYPTRETEDTKPKSTSNNKPTTTVSRPNNKSTAQQSAHGHGKVYKFLLYGGVLALVCLVSLLALLITEVFKASTTSNVISDEMISPEPSVTASNTSLPVSKSINRDNLIKYFLSNNDWSNESMEQFLSAWDNLDYEEQVNDLRSAAMRQLNHAIYQQFQEQNALLVLGDNDVVIEKQKALINFAEQLGIQDSRLVITDRP